MREINGNTDGKAELAAEETKFKIQTEQAVAYAQQLGYNFAAVTEGQIILLKNNRTLTSNIVAISSPRCYEIIYNSIKNSGGVKEPRDVFMVERPQQGWEKNFPDQDSTEK